MSFFKCINLFSKEMALRNSSSGQKRHCRFLGRVTFSDGWGWISFGNNASQLFFLFCSVLFFVLVYNTEDIAFLWNWSPDKFNLLFTILKQGSSFKTVFCICFAQFFIKMMPDITNLTLSTESSEPYFPFRGIE